VNTNFVTLLAVYMMSHRLLSKQQQQVYAGWPQAHSSSLPVVGLVADKSKKSTKLESFRARWATKQALGC
jgi:hypothetical protein